MNSDDYFPDDLDSGVLNQLDLIEAAHRPKLTHNPPTRRPPNSLPPPQPKPAPPKQVEKEDSYMDLTLDIDEADLQRLDSFIDAAYKGQATPVAGPSRPLSKSSLQTTLFGGVARPLAPTNKTSPASRGPMQRSKSDHRSPFGHQAPQTKQWDHTAFAKSGWKKPKSKGKGKGKSDEDEQKEAVEFEQFPAPFVQRTSWVPHLIMPRLIVLQLGAYLCFYRLVLELT